MARVNAPNSFAHLVPEVSSGSSRFPQTQRDHFVRASLVKCRACNLALKDHGVLHLHKASWFKIKQERAETKASFNSIARQELINDGEFHGETIVNI